MKRRTVLAALLLAMLAGCGKAPDDGGKAAAAPATTPVADTPAAAASAEASVEDGVEPSVWDNEGEPEGETPGAEITCEQQPLATYFFTLVGGNSVDNCGRKDAKVLAAFDALMKEATPAESTDPQILPLRERLLSGPSAPGQPLMLDGDVWWYYSACQAHQCSTTALDMLYAPTQAKMVGRLVAKCKVWWLGAPSAEQRASIEGNRPLDEASLQVDGEPCE
ncbi:hypothetical protein ATCM_05265 [Stenotrophomonas sp. ATCM1_4]|uniref:hypothetical protein n=1 Tax=Stenotrophomonas sp. ATCM1_4 TaxID=2259330 RepID=UPI0010450651|nr:hypothetical protein [Stenotrophomonas sp. ATCM1_4]TDB27107.1 hypothetical protein ATCM_05265 [Stenotrophomonas sp. ATCM1_4]